MSNPNYCSVANPQGSCKPISGIAIPMTAAALDQFKTLQRQLNRVLAKKGKRLLDVDGRLGPAAVAAVGVARDSGKVTGVLLSMQRTVDDIASNVDGVIKAVQGLADSLGAGASIADPKPSSPPSLPGPGGTVLHPPASQMAASAGAGGLSLSSPLVIGAVGVAALLLLNKKKPGRRRGRR